MTAKKQVLRIFNLLTLFLCLAAPVVAQNNLLPTNVSNFNIRTVGNGHTSNNLSVVGVTTDYDYVYTNNGLLGDNCAQHYAIGTNARWYSHNSVVGIETGMFDFADHTTGDGNYMIVNGATSSNKKVWEYIVDVTPGAVYQFQVYVTALYMYPYGTAPDSQKPRLQLKINGSNVGTAFTVPWNNNSGQWVEWTQNWTAGNNITSARITIIDNCLEANGNDFGLDDISFTPLVVYSADAVDDWDVAACQAEPVDIFVLGNDIILPNTTGATVSVVTPPAHGTYSLINNNTAIRYTFTGGNYTTDQLKYRVTNHGVYDEAWVHFNTNRSPQVSNITDPDPICAGGALDIPVPSVTPSADGVWEYCSSPNGTNWQSFNPLSVPLDLNDMYIRYRATNGCGSGYSENQVRLVVTNGPTWASGQAGQTPPINPICAGQSLSLTPPVFNANGSQILGQHWVASTTENGSYAIFNNDNLNNIPASYNGWYIRYRVEGSCGYIYSEPARLLTVNVAPSNVGTLVAPDAICAGEDLDMTAPAFDGTGNGAWEICQTQNGTYQPFSLQNVPATFNNWYLHYNVSNNCDSVSSNSVQIHVNDAPSIDTPSTPAAICAGDSFALTTPNIQDHGAAVTDQGWQISPTQNGAYNTFNNSNIPYTYNHYWIRYFAVNECNMSHSVAVQVTVNDKPVVGNIAVPAGICAGDSFDLTAPTVEWRHTNQGTGSWEIAPTSSGEFVPLNNNSIPYDYNGYYIRYKALNGCGPSYSTNVVQVTVYSTDPIDEGEITACDAIYHHGSYCNHDGTYVADSVTPNNCHIQVSWHFTLSEAYTETQNHTACESFTWPKNGHTYYSSCTDTYTYDSNNPLVCDSIFTLNLIINNAPEILDDITAPTGVCHGSPIDIAPPPYQMNHVDGGDAHWEYSTSSSGPFTAFDPSANTLDYGTYYLRYAVINACDEAYSNVVSFHVDTAPEALMELTGIQVCNGLTLDLPETNVNWNNYDENDRLAQWQMSSTQDGTYATLDPSTVMQMNYNGYWLRFVAHTSCGDDIVGPVQITVLSSDEQWLETITACDSYPLETGEVITQSQVVEYEVFEPCFHIVYQPIEINHSDYKVEPITSCREEYVWHGRTFYRSEQMQFAWDTLTNVDLCDSIVELNLSFGNFDIYTYNRTGCNSFVWDLNPTVTYTESVRDSVFVPATGADDCDTWHILDLTLGHDTIVNGGIMTECSGFEWHGIPYSEDAIIYDSLQTSITHCDSIIVYQLNIIPSVETDTSIVSCKPIMWYEHLCDTETEYQHVFESSLGCDSIVTMHFRFEDELTYEIDSTTCAPFTWYEYECNHDGMTCSHTFVTPLGCDSTVRLHVHINAPVHNVQMRRVCDSITIQGVFYSLPEGENFHSYRIVGDTLVGPNGCDSILVTNLMLRRSESIGVIDGDHHVYVASNIINGFYRYEIDTAHIQGAVSWSLSNPEWQIVDYDNTTCRIFVPTPGRGFLIAQFQSECGEMERSLEINAGFFGVDDYNTITANVYPNPTQGSLTVEAEGIETIRLTNMLGQVLDWREYDRSNTVILNLNGLTPSVYLLEIKTINGVVKKQVMVSR